jgi:hypothetical protein
MQRERDANHFSQQRKILVKSTAWCTPNVDTPVKNARVKNDYSLELVGLATFCGVHSQHDGREMRRHERWFQQGVFGHSIYLLRAT